MSTASPEALFAYRLRESRRARRIGLRVTPEHGLEVVVPPGFSSARIPAVLADKQRWIRGALERAERHRRLLGVDQPWRLPALIELPGIECAWPVSAEWRAQTRVTVCEITDGHLRIRGRLDDELQCRRALRRWLTAQAQRALAPRLHALSIETGLRFARVAFRQQRSRWGSCSRDRAISLNVNLLFLPPPLVRYVMVHELCHLVHLNHSARYWALVERLYPGARAHDRAMRDGWKSIPRWAR